MVYEWALHEGLKKSWEEERKGENAGSGCTRTSFLLKGKTYSSINVSTDIRYVSEAQPAVVVLSRHLLSKIALTLHRARGSHCLLSSFLLRGKDQRCNVTALGGWLIVRS